MANDRKKTIVFGAGGRAGTPIVAESLRRGQDVTAVVRDPARHPGLATLGEHVTVAAGDLTDPGSVAAVLADVPGEVAALVNAVAPFTATPDSVEGFDPDYYVRLVKNLGAAARDRDCRVIEIGLFAMLRTGELRVFQDGVAFPEYLRPFAVARLRGLNAWRDQGSVDWLVLTPPPRLSPDAKPAGRYRLGDDVLDPAATATLFSYDDLALAVVDQIETPTVHRCQAAVYSLA